MTKRSIPINDKKWDVTGQFAETWPVGDVLKKNSRHHRQMKARQLIDQSLEPASKALERRKVDKIDRLEDQGMKLKEDAYLRSLQFHFWDRDPDAYFYWDMK
jgi:hypothetical protein